MYYEQSPDEPFDYHAAREEFERDEAARAEYEEWSAEVSARSDEDEDFWTNYLTGLKAPATIQVGDEDIPF